MMSTREQYRTGTLKRMDYDAHDDVVFHALFDSDQAVAATARAIYDRTHKDDPPVREPAHCSECFEGCQKCQPERGER